MNPEKVFAVEVSGVCNLESFCAWCPMHNRPRNRARGLMDDSTLKRALYWVEKLDRVDALALHNFGEPLIHPSFDKYALEFSKLTPITMSTNCVLLDERWADRLAKVPWAWISLSQWKRDAVDKAIKLLKPRGIRLQVPPGITHDWAGQAKVGSKEKLFKGCHFLDEKKVVIRWDGDITSCCITDRVEDVIGHVKQEPSDVKMRGYSLCESCHHAKN